jgi:uncharacterized protein (TIGR02145 family)
LHYKNKNYRRIKLKTKIKVLFSFLLVVLVLSFGVRKLLSQVTDIDGNTYKTVIIGTQEWITENLNVEHYGNGDIIPQVQDKVEWSKLKTGAWCYYHNDSKIGENYGKLYNWYAINDNRGLAPEGWHIPSDGEWTILIDYLGGEGVAGGKLKATILWESPNKGATNESGFTAFPGGFRGGKGYFNYIGELGYFWSSSESSNHDAWYRLMFYDDSDVDRSYYNGIKGHGFSVRCVRD